MNARAHRVRAIGHLHEADGESQEFPDLHVAIRAVSKSYQTDGKMPEWEALAQAAEAVRPSIQPGVSWIRPDAPRTSPKMDTPVGLGGTRNERLRVEQELRFENPPHGLKNSGFRRENTGARKRYTGATVALRWLSVGLTRWLTPNRHRAVRRFTESSRPATPPRRFRDSPRRLTRTPSTSRSSEGNAQAEIVVSVPSTLV